MQLREAQAVMSAHNEGAAGSHRSELCLNLKAYRERSGIALEGVAIVTRIGLHFLRAIEAEEFAKLPGGVYNTSYIRQYARAVGYNPSAHRLTILALGVLLLSGKQTEQSRHREASRRLDRGIQGHSCAHSSRSFHPTLHVDAPFFFLPVCGETAPRVRTVPDALSQPQEPAARQSGGEEIQCPASLSAVSHVE
jgi:hypothetical protein